MTVTPQSLLDGAKVGWDSTAMAGTNVCLSEWMELGSGISTLMLIVPFENTGALKGEFKMELTNGDGSASYQLGLSDGHIDNDQTGRPRAYSVHVLTKRARLVWINQSGTGVLGNIEAHAKR